VEVSHAVESSVETLTEGLVPVPQGQRGCTGAQGN